MPRGQLSGAGRQLELQQIRRWVGDTTFERGLDYADRGKVLQPARVGDMLTAEVEGSTPRGKEEPTKYGVSVDLKPAVPRASCTCPVRRTFCKHSAAVLIKWHREPEGFLDSAAEPEAPGPGLKAARKPSRTAQRQQMLLAELDAVADMLRDAAVSGIAVAAGRWTESIPEMISAARRRRQRRLGALLDELHRELAAAGSGEGGTEQARCVGLLTDVWFTIDAMRRHVEGKLTDERALEELVGKIPRQAGLARRYGVPLLALAYEVYAGPLGARHDVSYFMDLNSGELFVERVVVPQRRAKREPLKQSHAAPLLARHMGIYPGYPPPRVALIDVEQAALSLTDAMARALDLADASLVSVHERLVQLAAEPIAPRETFALLKLGGLLDRHGVLHLLDGEGYVVPVAESPPGHPPTQAAFEQYAEHSLPPAVFARFVAGDASMCAAPLSILEAGRIVPMGE